MKSNLAVCFFVMLAAAGAQVAQPAASAGVDQNYPTRPIRLIVPQAPGGSNDIMARFIGNYLTERLGRQVVVDNRPGAEGMLGTEIVARSAPDGYTLLMVSAAFTMNPAVRKVPYDPLKAFDWVAMLGSGPTVLTVGPSLPVNSVQELLAVGKAKPGHLNMAASTGAGHFWSAFFRSLSGVDLVILVYKGGFPAMIDVMGGQAHMTVGSIIQALPYIRSGKLKPLATGGAKRSATLPDLPTIAEAGSARLHGGQLVGSCSGGRHASRHHRQDQHRSREVSQPSRNPETVHERRRRSGHQDTRGTSQDDPQRHGPMGQGRERNRDAHRVESAANSRGKR